MDNVKAQKLRNLAFEKLKDRSKFNAIDIFKVVQLIRDYRATHKILNEKDFSGVVEQIKRDIGIYKKYDCLAMWLDWESGLVKYEPDLIEKIARDVGGLEIKEGE